MPAFAVSLLDSNNDVALAIVGSTISISDYSNYIASTEAGHLVADFHAKKIIVQKIGETDTYTFCTSAGCDELIAYPSTFTTTSYPPIVDYYTFSSDGVYEVTLMAVPMFGKHTYDLNDCVVSGGLIYQSLKNLNTDAVSVTTSWEQITEADLPDKYKTMKAIAVDCSLLSCYADLVYQSNCVELNIDCNDVELCSNKTWRNTARLSMIIDSIQTLMDNEDYDKAAEMINQGSLICSCCQ